MVRDGQLHVLAWHQRSSSLDARERLLGALTTSAERFVLATCHRVELYAIAPAATASEVARDHGVPLDQLPDAVADHGTAAAAHLFAVAAGLESAIAGEPQVLGQIKRAYRAGETLDPSLAALLERALYVGRLVRREFGLTDARSVGSLAVDAALGRLATPESAVVLAIGAGEMGKLAVRALAKRTGHVFVANRDVERARAVAYEHGAMAIPLSDVPSAVLASDAVISAADTRGTVLTHEVLVSRMRLPRPLVVVDIAVPRAVDDAARELLGRSYVSVDDLPGAAARVDAWVLERARERCAAEAERFFRERAPASVAAIRLMRDAAERVRAAKLERALGRLGHLSQRDRRVVEALSTTLTNALLHDPTVAVRERRADPEAARALFERPRP